MARDWEKEFYKVSEIQEQDEKVFVEKVQKLCRAIVRLCVATSGLDTSLDPHLLALKKAAKQNDSEKILTASGALADAMLTHEEPAPIPDLLSRILASASAHKLPVNEIQKIVEQHSKNPESVSDTQIDKIISLLMSGKNECEESTDKKGILGRLIQKKSQTPLPDEQYYPHNVLLELMDKLSWPTRVEQDIKHLKERLSENTGLPDSWRKNVEQIAQLISEILGQAQSEIRSAENFLVQVTGQLEALDDFVRNGRQQREASLASSQKLEADVGKSVNDMHTNISSASDFDQLKDNVNHGLQLITQHVQEHVKAERQRNQNLAVAEQGLHDRTELLEQQMQALRKELKNAHRKAYTDAVTGISNRMAYDERVNEEYARWRRFHSYLVLMVWDIDDFKQVNDRFGHQSGDKALRIIAQILKKRIRETDFIARYGGEEMVVLLVGTPMIEAVSVANQMREEVAESGFHSGGKKVTVTLSCGVSEFLQGDTIESVFQRADEALYQAKQEGKNCVISR